MVYQTRVETRTAVRSTPEGLKSFLPPLLTKLKSRQQTTVSVRAVHAEGTVDVETRLGELQFRSNLIERLPEEESVALHAFSLLTTQTTIL